jgi:hypothetical protein
LAAFLPFLRPSPLAVSALTFASHAAIGLSSFAHEDVDRVDATAPVHALEDTELRASDADFRVAGPVLEDAAETEAGRELPESEGTTRCLPTLGLWLAELRASDAGCGVRRGEVGVTSSKGVAGDAGPLFCPRELTLAGGAVRLLREAVVPVLVVRDFATLARSSMSPSSDWATGRLAKLTVDCVSVAPAFKRNPSSDESS